MIEKRLEYKGHTKSVLLTQPANTKEVPAAWWRWRRCWGGGREVVETFLVMIPLLGLFFHSSWVLWPQKPCHQPAGIICLCAEILSLQDCTNGISLNLHLSKLRMVESIIYFFWKEETEA